MLQPITRQEVAFFTQKMNLQQIQHMSRGIIVNVVFGVWMTSITLILVRLECDCEVDSKLILELE